MSCQEYEDRLSDYIDLALPQPEHGSVEAHLKQCPRCSALCQDLMTICQASRGIPEIEPPERVWVQIEAVLSRERMGSAPIPARGGAGVVLKHNYQRSAFLIAATLLVVFGLFWAYRAIQVRQATPQAISAVDNRDYDAGPVRPGGPLLQPVGILIVHKPNIEASIVEQRIRELEQQIRERQTRWDPEIRRVFDKHLTSVNYNLEHGLRRLRDHRDDPAAREIYQAALLAKKEMLKQFAEL